MAAKAYPEIVSWIARAGAQLRPVQSNTSAADKRRALSRLAAKGGTQAVEAAARSAAAIADHPFVLALTTASDIDAFLRKWTALCAIAHSHNLFEVERVDAQTILVKRRRRDARATQVLEDRFILGLFAGLLERACAMRVEFHIDRMEAETRFWRGTLSSISAPPSPTVEWGAYGNFSKQAARLLRREPMIGSSRIAKALGLHPRALQRALQAEGASVRLLKSKRRLALAAIAMTAKVCDSITTCAQNSGFADGAQLSRDFRRFVGLSPSAWRRIALLSGGSVAKVQDTRRARGKLAAGAQSPEHKADERCN